MSHKTQKQWIWDATQATEKEYSFRIKLGFYSKKTFVENIAAHDSKNTHFMRLRTQMQVNTSSTWYQRKPSKLALQKDFCGKELKVSYMPVWGINGWFVIVGKQKVGLEQHMMKINAESALESKEVSREQFLVKCATAWDTVRMMFTLYFLLRFFKFFDRHWNRFFVLLS